MEALAFSMSNCCLLTWFYSFHLYLNRSEEYLKTVLLQKELTLINKKSLTRNLNQSEFFTKCETKSAIDLLIIIKMLRILYFIIT